MLSQHGAGKAAAQPYVNRGGACADSINIYLKTWKKRQGRANHQL
jgi:hypothetical protein